MAYESTTIIGSGTTTQLNRDPSCSQRDDGERSIRGTNAVVINPEDASADKTFAVTQVTVGDTAARLPSAPLKYRRAISIKNHGSVTLFVGSDSSVTTSNGYPLDAGETLNADCKQNVEIWGITDSSTDCRIIELS